MGKRELQLFQPEEYFVKLLSEKLGGIYSISIPGGKVDILTYTEIIEVKEYSRWKEALGQILAHGYFYPHLEKRIHLIGSGDTDSSLIYIKEICNGHGIIVTVQDDELRPEQDFNDNERLVLNLLMDEKKESDSAIAKKLGNVHKHTHIRDIRKRLYKLKKIEDDGIRQTSNGRSRKNGKSANVIEKKANKPEKNVKNSKFSINEKVKVIVRVINQPSNNFKINGLVGTVVQIVPVSTNLNQKEPYYGLYIDEYNAGWAFTESQLAPMDSDND
ncbi:MAG: hypothetical protein KME57_07740 [Scytonema hyalinum WJT4-NPBG1]|jgi:hypothetical protein|nr:hypothetical protein [Scytonema hyalinum WJT4-NPBG1]